MVRRRMKHNTKEESLFSLPNKETNTTDLLCLFFLVGLIRFVKHL